MPDTLIPFRDNPSGNPEYDLLIRKTACLGKDVNGTGYGVVWLEGLRKTTITIIGGRCFAGHPMSASASCAASAWFVFEPVRSLLRLRRVVFFADLSGIFRQIP